MKRAGAQQSTDFGQARGLFIDLDGTLADSVAALKSVYFSFLSEFGVQGTEEEFQMLNGPPLRQIVEWLKKNHQLPEAVEELTAQYVARVRHAHEKAVPATGGQSVLRLARERGWKTAVVTSSPRAVALEWLKRADLLELVDVVVAGDEVARGKPAPDPYLRALARTNCAAASSIAVEDSPAGAAAAVAAGLGTLVIGRVAARDDWPEGVSFIDRLVDVTKELQR